MEGEGAEPEPAPPDAVLEPEPPVDGLAACLPLFTAGSGHRRFIRTLKPLAGSSFKARPQLMRLWQSPSWPHVSKPSAGCATGLHVNPCCYQCAEPNSLTCKLRRAYMLCDPSHGLRVFHVLNFQAGRESTGARRDGRRM